MKGVVLALFVCLCFAQKHPFPVLPKSYDVSFTLQLPQWNGSAPAQPVRIIFDGDAERERIEYWNGDLVNVVQKRFVGYSSHWKYPEQNKMVCSSSVVDNILGMSSAFPVHVDGWEFAGERSCGSLQCEVWTRYVPEGGATNNFTFFVNANTGNPVSYQYMGMTGTLVGYLHSPNYDWFVINYTNFDSSPRFNSSTFELSCDSTVAQTEHRSGGFDLDLFSKQRNAEPHRLYKPKSKSVADLPTEVDWRKKGVVWQVKDQGDCGSCWSFGSAAAVESAYAIKHGTLLSLSEQVLLDCTWSHGNNACWGGSQAAAYKGVLDNLKGKWPLEKDYSYRQNPSLCATNKTSPVTLVDYHYVVGTHSLMDALANVGPVAVAISTYPSAPFTFYHEGVYENILCQPLIPDHVVLAVGYGTDSNGKDFWILKNQWSGFWGEEGFMRISRTLDDCGVASYGVLPVVA